MVFVAIIIAALIVYALQGRIYSRHAFDNLEYNVTLSTDEAFEGEDIFMYEELTNAKRLPLPAVRVDTSLPTGLCFRLKDKTDYRGKREEFTDYNQSAFVLRSAQKIKRRWRILCKTRGSYDIGNVLLVTSDLFGTNSFSKAVEAGKGRHNHLVVLPKTIDLEKNFTSSHYHSGDVPVLRSMLTDPLIISGSREYTPDDPMSKINWNSTAAHGKLMVNVEDYTERHNFNLILNMQSRSVELHPHEPSSPQFVELCITVAASILDKVSLDNIPVRLFANTSPSDVGLESASDDEIGGQIVVTKPYKGKGDILDALRLLAILPMSISCQFDKMLDHILANPYYYSNGGNIIVVSSYIDERMIVFHSTMAHLGVRVVFYITTSNQNATFIPADVEVYYKTYIE